MFTLAVESIFVFYALAGLLIEVSVVLILQVKNYIVGVKRE